ncbi:hypothetical protein ACFXP7_06680 [Microbacterium sp. P06]|uniref:hypothetical protein n=1 Tax=unclassified Microbacterium TaxID=2609290 RepID=UPI003746CD39
MTIQIKKSLRKIGAGVTAFAGVFLLSVALAPSASANNGTANITNGGSAVLLVCESAASETECGGTFGGLNPGDNSQTHKGWVDTDMVKVPANCAIERYVWSSSMGNHWQTFATAGASDRWIKTGGTPTGSVNYNLRAVC